MSQPINDIHWNRQKNPEGISMRDYFAAAALQGILANGGSARWDDDATNAYLRADTMLKARGEK